jgi:hypothetical protein
MKHVHTFACPVFALQNALAAGNAVFKWSPRARLGLNLGPSPTHARHISLVLSLSTGLVSPQYHCRFNDFFETTKYSGPDVSDSSTWQQLARLGHANKIPSQGLSQLLHSPMSTETPSDINAPSEESGISNDEFTVTWDKEIDSNQDPQVKTSQQDAQASQEAEGASSTTSTLTAGTSQRGQACTMSRKKADSVSQRDFYGNANMHYMASQSLMGETDEDLVHDTHLELLKRMRNPIAFHDELMGDIMYYHQALKQPDASQFVDAIIKEINGHVDNKHWRLAKQDTVPEDVQIVPSVWSLQRKRDLTTNKITKHKARLNLHGGKQVYSMNYYETYAPVVTWFAIRLMIVFGILFQWSLRQVDFVMAYPQAPIKMDIYMELQGIQTATGNSKDHVLQLLKNIYG